MFLGAAGSVQAGTSIIYVGDFSGGTGSINYFDAATGGFILNTGVPGSAMGTPGQMVIGPNLDLFIADTENTAGYVDVFDSTTGAYLSQFGSAQLASPVGLALSVSGDLFVADSINDVVDEFTLAGAFVSQVVSPAADALSNPDALTTGPDGNLYISYQDGNVYKYNVTTHDITLFAAFQSGGAEALNLVFGPDGNLYVMSAFNGGEVLVYNGTTGDYIGVFGNTGTALGAGALGMAFGADGNLYVADSNGVDVVDGTTGNVTGNFIPAGGTVVIPQFLAFSTTTASTPEPFTLPLSALGLLAIGWLRLRGRMRLSPIELTRRVHTRGSASARPLSPYRNIFKLI
jgi:WD40 repeat protein